MRYLFTLFSALLICCSTTFAQPGNALHFDGSNDMVVCGLPTVFSSISTNDFTFEAWVYPTSGIFSRIIYAQFATNNFATMSMGGTANIYFYVVSNGTNYSTATTANMPLNQWTHVAARWTAGTQSLAVFFNGVLQSGSAGGTSSTGTSGLMTIGTRPGGFQYFPGAIDEVRVWSEARSLCEIQGNFNRHFTGPETNLVAFYDFNHGVPAGNNAGITTLTDYSGSANNGTLTNFALTGATSNWIASTANITSSGAAVGGFSSADSAAVCSGDSYTFHDGSTQTNITSQVVHTSTFTATNGCDSVITTTVNVNPSSSQTDSTSVCSGDSYTFPDSTTQTNITSQVVHTSTLTGANGCDSVIVTTVDVNPTYNSSDAVTICSGGSVLYPDGTLETNITQTTVHTSTLSTVAGCDSIIVTTVNVDPVYNLSDSATVCAGGSFTFHDGTTQTNILSQVTHTSSLATVQGCDSILVTTVNVTVVDTSVSISGITLTANATGASYQWIDCNAGSPLPGDTNATYNPPLPGGSFAVIVTQSGCTDTSNCWVIITGGVNEGHLADYALSPNPNTGEFVLEFKNPLALAVEVDVINALGQVVYRANMSGAGRHSIELGTVADGIYTLRIHDGERMVPIKVVVEH